MTEHPRLSALTDALMADDRIEAFAQPNREAIAGLIGKMKQLLFPGYFCDPASLADGMRPYVAALLEDIAARLTEQIAIALRLNARHPDAQALTLQFLSHLPEIRTLLQTDLDAFFDGDPAATSREEIIIAYPGIFAIMVSRLAHVLFQLGVPLIPRIMTEHAHSRTGIDIHPGATIGRSFFIDHGTGIVIGETAVIGDHVTLYQGVTLGALSTRGGQNLRGKRRHPTIEDRVTIYAGASVLGGDTVIGHDAVIGGSAFITSSIAPGMRVSVKHQELEMRPGKQS